jgi:hypothetical protein
MRTTLSILALLPLSVPLHPGLALAEGDVAGAACMPNDVTVAEDKFLSGSGSYFFNPLADGTMVFTCPVTLVDGNYRLNLSYANDVDGSSEAGHYVKVEWKRLSKPGLVVSTLCTDYSLTTATETRWMCPGLYFNVSNSNYTYFVSITLHQTGPRANSIRFDGISFISP